MSYEFTRVDTVEPIDFDKSVIFKYKKFDVIEDIKLKSWVVWEVNREEETLKILKYPILNEKNIYTILDLTDENTVKRIRQVFRTKKEEE